MITNNCNYISNKGLIYKVYKNLLQLKDKKYKYFDLKIGK